MDKYESHKQPSDVDSHVAASPIDVHLCCETTTTGVLHWLPVKPVWHTQRPVALSIVPWSLHTTADAVDDDEAGADGALDDDEDEDITGMGPGDAVDDRAGSTDAVDDDDDTIGADSTDAVDDDATGSGIDDAVDDDDDDTGSG